ncbi:MAG: glycosyltransferase family 4 protein [Sphingomicrobium sp.]
MRRLKAHRPIILTNLDSELSEAWRSHGMEMHVVSEQASVGLKRSPVGTVRSYRRYHRALAGILATSGARIVHANDPLAFQLSLSAVKRSPGARIALNLRDTLDPGRRPPRRKYRMLFAAADHVLYLSADMAKRWCDVAPNAMASYSVTYSIVDPIRFAASPIASDPAKIVLVPGILRPKKGQLDFIRNVVPVLARNDVATWFAGDFEPGTNSYAAACAAAAEPYGAAIRFLGYQAELPDVIREATVVAIPSRHEGLVRGMIEAMACGRPVVSFDVCSAREILEDKAAGAGVVLASEDYAGMAAALVRYSGDADARAAAGAVGSAAARVLFDADQVIGRYERVYRELGQA